MRQAVAAGRPECIFHLAALLSTRSEFTPVSAHHVNVEGTLHLLEFAQKQGESHGRPVVFVYPSSIAAYGLPIKIVVMNNGYLGMVRQWQELFYSRTYSEVGLEWLPDFVRLAEAYHATGLRASRPEELRTGPRRAARSSTRYASSRRRR